MIGSEGVTRYLVEKLKAAMPAKLAELRTRLTAITGEAVTEQHLPEVQRWYAHDIDQLEVGGFPAVLVVESESVGQIANREITYGEEADEYTFEYILRVYVWAMGDSAGGTTLQVKRLVSAVEEILLFEKLIYSAHDGDEYAKVDPKFIKHSYSDVEIDQARQVLGGGYVEVHIATRELLRIQPPIIGSPVPIEFTVEAVTVDTSLI